MANTLAGFFAALAAGALMIAPAGHAAAAELRGDCCADLEARVAALEASAANHGNHLQSMKISGWINAAAIWWADGGSATDGRDPNFHDQTSDVYFVNNDAAQTRINIQGLARIRDDLSAGYSIGLRPFGPKLSTVSQISAKAGQSNFDVRDTYVFVDSRQLGKLQLGEQLSAADGAWYQDLGGSSTWISNVNPGAWNNNFNLRDGKGRLSAVTWGNVLNEMSDTQVARVAYYSRQIYGFQGAASFGDNTWAVALYSSQHCGTVNVLEGIGYDVSSGASALGDQLVGTGLVDQGNTRLAKFAMSESIYESTSGLYGTYGLSSTQAAVAGRQSAANIYGKAGWRRNVSGFGETNVYGEYDHTAGAYANGVNAHVWGAGVTQDVDSAGLALYAGYRHTSLDNSIWGANLIPTAAQTASHAAPETAATIWAQSFDAVLGGMVVQF